VAGATMPPEVLNPDPANGPDQGGGKGWLSRLTGGLIR